MAVSKRLRFEILRRDNHTCRYCGATAPEVKLHIDHVIPESLGGTDDPSNLVAACEPCNSGKSSVPPEAPLVADVAADAARWAAAMQQVAVWRDAQREVVQGRREFFLAKWNTWSCNGEPIELPADWPATVDRLIAAGLELGDLAELVDVAMRSRADDTWRYFCGCCWRRITDNQEIARAIIARAIIAQEQTNG